jgi:hypothetical protein
VKTAKRPLDSDYLGNKGEQRFGEICGDAQMICNSSCKRDRAGWDAIVELPFGQTAGKSFDKRPLPFTCRFQVKTIWSDRDTFKMRLTSAECLAKEPGPAFLYVFKVDEKLDFVEAYLIHLFDDPLADILRRLRAEAARQAPTAFNQRFVTLSASILGRKLPPTGAALRQAIEEICGAELGAYIERKRDHIAKLGFDGYPFNMSATFHFGEDNTVTDFSLGRTEVPISELRGSETRFGIDLPLRFDGDTGIMKLTPSPADTCTVVLRPKGQRAPSRFEGHVIAVPPWIVKPSPRSCMVETEGFNFCSVGICAARISRRSKIFWRKRA